MTLDGWRRRFPLPRTGKGCKVAKVKSEYVHVRITVETHKRAAVIAAQKGWTLPEVLHVAVTRLRNALAD
jgi:hypothetical protein